MTPFSFGVVVVVFALTGCGGLRPVATATGVPPHPPLGLSGDFIRKGIAHQRAAVEMGETCIQKASRVELREFCKELLVREQSEMDQLKVWSATWYLADAALSAVKEKITAGYQNFEGDIRSKSGPAFDEALVRAIRLHHNEGLSESVSCTSGSVHDELKVYCTNARSEQEAELRQLNTWVCQWFRDCIAR
jgi:uncharacterized protein (DUF305 family)